MIEYLKNPEFWKRVRTDESYKPLLEKVFESYNEYCKDKEIPILRFTDEMEYFKNGNRASFQEPYFIRREQMAVYTILSLVYPENEEYFNRLQDVLNEIATEYSWQVPAHRGNDTQNKRDGHSLFAAETAFYMAEVKCLFADRLNPCLVERITEAIDTKILSSFEGRETGVERKKITNNWASVCAGAIGIAFMYESPERFMKIKPRIEKCMENYLSGLTEDGATPEGAVYWNYGFTFYMFYYETLRRFSKGKDIQGLEKEKVKKFARFFTSVCLDKKNRVCFGDSAADSNCSMWLVEFLKREYDIIMPPSEAIRFDTDTPSILLRVFLDYNADYFTDTLEEEEKFFDILQWYVKRKKNYGFAIKAGENNPEDGHNHNDIGSFVVVNDGKEILCDLGRAEYTADNFGKNRYKIINNTSLGHNVPIVNGEEQAMGDGCFGTIEVGEEVVVDMKNAYSMHPDKLLRRVHTGDNEIVITDEFSKDLDIVERFITESEPVRGDGYLMLDKTKLESDDMGSVNIEYRVIKAHFGEDRPIYIIDFKPSKDTFKLKISFE